MLAAVIFLVGATALLCLMIVTIAWLAYRSRMATLRVIGDAALKGQPVDPALTERLLGRTKGRVGKWFAIICLALGLPELGVGAALALSGALLMQGASAAGMMVGAMVNLCAGSGLAILGLVSLRRFMGRPEPRWDFAGILSLVCLFFGVAGLGVGTGLALGSQFYGPIGAAGAVRSGLLVGAMVNALSGFGLICLGVIVTRVFAEPRETGES